jgi:hypothetical protein
MERHLRNSRSPRCLELKGQIMAVEERINMSTWGFGSGELGGNLARAEGRLPRNSRNGFTHYKSSVKALSCAHPWLHYTTKCS